MLRNLDLNPALSDGGASVLPVMCSRILINRELLVSQVPSAVLDHG